MNGDDNLPRAGNTRPLRWTIFEGPLTRVGKEFNAQMESLRFNARMPGSMMRQNIDVLTTDVIPTVVAARLHHDARVVIEFDGCGRGAEHIDNELPTFPEDLDARALFAMVAQCRAQVEGALGHVRSHGRTADLKRVESMLASIWHGMGVALGVNRSPPEAATARACEPSTDDSNTPLRVAAVTAREGIVRLLGEIAPGPVYSWLNTVYETLDRGMRPEAYQSGEARDLEQHRVAASKAIRLPENRTRVLTRAIVAAAQGDEHGAAVAQEFDAIVREALLIAARAVKGNGMVTLKLKTVTDSLSSAIAGKSPDARRDIEIETWSNLRAVAEMRQQIERMRGEMNALRESSAENAHALAFCIRIANGPFSEEAVTATAEKLAPAWKGLALDITRARVQADLLMPFVPGIYSPGSTLANLAADAWRVVKDDAAPEWKPTLVQLVMHAMDKLRSRGEATRDRNAVVADCARKYIEAIGTDPIAFGSPAQRAAHTALCESLKPPVKP